MKSPILALLLVLVAAWIPAQSNALTVTELGNVEVTGDLSVDGTLFGSTISDKDYESWAVGQYYQRPMANRTGDWDVDIANLSTAWTMVDLSQIVPAGTKRVRVFLELCGDEGAMERVLFLSRPYGATSESWIETGHVLIQTTGGTGYVRVATEVELEVDSSGRLEIKQYADASWSIAQTRMQLRGFYK